MSPVAGEMFGRFDAVRKRDGQRDRRIGKWTAYIDSHYLTLFTLSSTVCLYSTPDTEAGVF